MTEKQFKKLQHENIKSREQVINLLGEEHKALVEKVIANKEREYGRFIGMASIVLTEERSCLVEKYESSYVIVFMKGEETTQTVRLSYEMFYGFGLLWNGFRTDEDSAHFFSMLEDKK